MRCWKRRARASRRAAPDGGSRSAAPQRAGRPRQQHARDGEGAGAGSRRGVPRPRGRRRAGRQGAGPRERDRGADRPGLVGLQRVGADQRAGHALVLPRHRRGGRAGRLAAGHDPDPEGGDPGRRPVRGHDARPDRGGLRPGADQPAHPDRDGAGHGQRRGDRADLPASGWRRWCSASPTTRPRPRRAPPTSAEPTPTTRC